jgi:hypothetical protein
MRSYVWSPIDGISCFIRRGKEIQTLMLALSPLWCPTPYYGTAKQPPPDASTTTLDFPAFRTIAKQTPILYKLPRQGCYVKSIEYRLRQKALGWANGESVLVLTISKKSLFLGMGCKIFPRSYRLLKQRSRAAKCCSVIEKCMCSIVLYSRTLQRKREPGFSLH